MCVCVCVCNGEWCVARHPEPPHHVCMCVCVSVCVRVCVDRSELQILQNMRDVINAKKLEDVIKDVEGVYCTRMHMYTCISTRTHAYVHARIHACALLHDVIYSTPRSLT